MKKSTAWTATAVAVPLLLVAAQLFFNHVLDIPLNRVARNMLLPPTPPPVQGKYQCDAAQLAEDVTVVVTVKDACSQAPGFIAALHDMLPSSVHLIYTFPNFSSCASIPGMSEQLATWDKVTLLPLPLRVSPMRGWVDAVPHITTPYSLLLHNDGYALDPFFACELVEALKARNHSNATAEGEPRYIAAAPMLYESKADRSLAAHATQSNLRLVKDRPEGGVTVRHDHSVRRALNRGSDLEEGPQSEFLEDHGFMVETDKISAIIDPHASYTLEYIDMIMTIRSNGWMVLFVPTARLEFRITEFSWRDIPYFMYKRSEATCHGTRDYLTAKWKAAFPNTGFWTYIKYTIVEQHVYGPQELLSLPWKDSAAIGFGFFQMMGFNRYTVPTRQGQTTVDYITILEQLDQGWAPSEPFLASRELARPTWQADQVKPTKLPISDILPTVEPSTVRIEADMPLEYLPFAAAEFKFRGPTACTTDVPEPLLPLCGLLVQHESSCSCWVNLPTFKSNNWFIQALDRLAALIKLPSRVTTYIEMAMGSTRGANSHVLPLTNDYAGVRVVTCESAASGCNATVELGAKSRVVQYVGRPPSITELTGALARMS